MPEIRTKITCADGLRLGGHWWLSETRRAAGTVVINPATGVLARYYHRYAAFLASHGFNALTYDYRGIGLSRPERLRGRQWNWRDWGELDVDAALRHAAAADPEQDLMLVGHSIGGFLPGYAITAARLRRMLTVGAQHAYWPDYQRSKRLGLFFKWHMLMPALTAVCGYFPGRKLGWLEDLPAGVVWSWSFGGRRFEARLPLSSQPEIRARFAAVEADILAISVSDDHFATRPALGRALASYSGSRTVKVMLEPRDLDREEVGHFDLFHSRHASGFWLDTLLWLRDGINPWPRRRFD